MHKTATKICNRHWQSQEHESAYLSCCVVTAAAVVRKRRAPRRDVR